MSYRLISSILQLLKKLIVEPVLAKITGAEDSDQTLLIVEVYKLILPC